MEIPILRAPYIKGKNFLVNDVAVRGIPKEADSRRNKKVIGTPAWERYWSEMLHRCIHGYQTGGYFIPGRFYYYMNFNPMTTINGIITPDMVDLHLELAYLIEYAKSKGVHKNIICAKKRRAGVSEFTQKAVVDYGYRFSHGYKAGIAAGLDTYIKGFMTKWNASDSLIVPEFRTKTLLNNNKEVTAGYIYKDENGTDIIGGSGSAIYTRTMHGNANLFKGEFLNDVVAEECGEFELLKEFFEATEDCLMDGDTQVGTMFCYGTANKMDKGTKDFAEMWYNADDYNMLKFMIDARRFHKPHYGGAKRGNEIVAETPYLLQKYKPYELIGVEDLKAAEDHIVAKSEKLKKRRQAKIHCL